MMKVKKNRINLFSYRYFWLSLILLMGMSGNMSAFTKYWHQKSSLYDKLKLEPGDIVFFGNSITDGGEFDELFKNEKIKNRGISGDVVQGLLKRVHQATNNHPSKIFILIGINDIANGKTPEKIASEYDRLLTEIKRATPGTKIYVQSVMPIDNSFKVYKNLSGKESLIPELNGRLKALAAKHKVEFIDLWPALADSKTGRLKKEYTNDGLHLLGRGYSAWADAIRERVNE